MFLCLCKPVKVLAYVSGLILIAALGGCGEHAPPRACQTALKNIQQLIVVLAPDANGKYARVVTLRRSVNRKQNDDQAASTTDQQNGMAWQLAQQPVDAVLGGAGLGWGRGFEGLRQSDEVIKQEGDKRSPAGVYPVGVTFGFGEASWSDHLDLKKHRYFCVDDLASDQYGAIVKRETLAPETSGEDMATISVYKRGVVVDYPRDRQQKSGSCIFFHIWQAPDEGTAGCIALDEADVAGLQTFAASAKTAAVIWPMAARGRLKSCIPNLPDAIFETATLKNQT